MTVRPFLLLVPLVIVSAALAGCAPATTSAPPAESAPAGEPSEDDSTGLTADTSVTAGYGCTDDMLAYLAQNGFGDVPPVDPATFSFPDGVDIAATPTCFVAEDDGVGAARKSALFYSDPDDVLAQTTSAFAAAGWQGGPSGTLTGTMGIWWSDGADVTAAKYSVGGGVLDIEGTKAAWFTWGY